MRWMLVALVVVACVCQSQDIRLDSKIAVKGSAVDASRWPNAGAVISDEVSSLTYPVQVVGYGEDGKHAKNLNVTPDYALSIYGGQLLGGDRGEWGGELVFRDKAGVIHPLLNHNVVGIVPMPFGTVVFTSLAHGTGEGAIYTVGLDKDGLPRATLLYDLQGSVSDILWTVNDDLVFTVQPGLRTKQDLFPPRSPECHVLDKKAVLSTVSCGDVAEP
jgi:hypothetical protein